MDLSFGLSTTRSAAKSSFFEQQCGQGTEGHRLARPSRQGLASADRKRLPADWWRLWCRARHYQVPHYCRRIFQRAG